MLKPRILPDWRLAYDSQMGYMIFHHSVLNTFTFFLTGHCPKTLEISPGISPLETGLSCKNSKKVRTPVDFEMRVSLTGEKNLIYLVGAGPSSYISITITSITF